ncbi:dual specificity protein phosphatase 1-like [Littorina saxatilis]|uniref:dual specificity protein phosphatase 1-like n=1 Tax=Littorina saxatilis TaxID=31220 RepID=UPI0038B62BB0
MDVKSPPAFLSPRELGRMMEGRPSSVQPVDCRSFLHYNSDRITGSVNIFCPPLVKKRFCSSLLPLDNMLSAETRATLCRPGVGVVVLYDDDSDEESWQTPRCDLQLVMDSLVTFFQHHDLAFFVLAGGYSCFQRECPHLCSSHTSLSGQLKSLDRIHVHTPHPQSQTHPSAHMSFHTISPVELLPYLYIGDASHASMKEQLQDVSITAILNVSTCCRNHFPHDFRYKVIPVEDSNCADLSTWFSDAFQFIEQEKQRGGKVLVHCRGGISRSATVCLAYLMYSRALRLDDAFAYVRARRHIISPNAGFMMQLAQFEAELRNLGFDRASMPLKPALSPCRLFSHSKSAFDLTTETESTSTARSPTSDVSPSLSCVPLVS